MVYDMFIGCFLLIYNEKQSVDVSLVSSSVNIVNDALILINIKNKYYSWKKVSCIKFLTLWNLKNAV